MDEKKLNELLMNEEKLREQPYLLALNPTPENAEKYVRLCQEQLIPGPIEEDEVDENDPESVKAFLDKHRDYKVDPCYLSMYFDYHNKVDRVSEHTLVRHYFVDILSVFPTARIEIIRE